MHPTKGTTTKSTLVGRRVELPAFSDQWMRGARFGTVRRIARTAGGTVLLVKCDHPQVRRLYAHFVSNFTPADGKGGLYE